MACTHPTADNHIVRRDPGGQTWWRCSSCKHVGLWAEGFSYFGTIECRKCAHPVIERVACSKCSVGKTVYTSVPGRTEKRAVQDDLDDVPPSPRKRGRSKPAIERDMAAQAQTVATNHSDAIVAKSRVQLLALCREYLAANKEDP